MYCDVIVTFLHASTLYGHCVENVLMLTSKSQLKAMFDHSGTRITAIENKSN